MVSRQIGTASTPPNCLNSTALPSITGIAARRADVAEAEHGGAVGDDGDGVRAPRCSRRASAGSAAIASQTRATPGRVGQREVVAAVERRRSSAISILPPTCRSKTGSPARVGGGVGGLQPSRPLWHSRYAARRCRRPRTRRATPSQPRAAAAAARPGRRRPRRTSRLGDRADRSRESTPSSGLSRSTATSPRAVAAAGGALHGQRPPSGRRTTTSSPGPRRRAVPHEQPVAVAQRRQHRAAAHDAPARDAGTPAVHGYTDLARGSARRRVSARGVVSQSTSSITVRRKDPACSRDCSPRPSKSQAHCDLPCGVYDPAQARIEAESIKAIIAKVADNDDPDFRTRAILIKEQRSELVKHHLWVLWTDYFKPPHFEKYPQLHTLVNEATKLAGATGTKGSLDAGDGRRAARQDRRDRRDLLGDQEGLSSTCHDSAPPGPAHRDTTRGVGR